MRNTILHALSVAAERFAENAKTMRGKAKMWGQIDGTSARMQELADQFENQANETYAAHALLSEGVLVAFSTDSAAFQSGFAREGCRRILRGLSAQIGDGETIGGDLKDANNLLVGFWSLEHADVEAAPYDGPAAAAGYVVEPDPDRPGAWIMDNADFGDLGDSFLTEADAWAAAEDHREASEHDVTCARRDNSKRCTCGLTS